MEIVNIEEKKSSYFLKDLRNFKTFLRKDVASDNIKSHQKEGFYRLFRKHIFGETDVKWSPQFFSVLKKFIQMLSEKCEDLGRLEISTTT